MLTNRGYLQTKELAAVGGHCRRRVLESILSALTLWAKFLTSKIELDWWIPTARHPKDIRIGDIVSRLEGKKLIEEDEAAPAHEKPGEVAIRLVHSELSGALRTVLNGMSLAEMTERVSQNTRGGQMYYI